MCWSVWVGSVFACMAASVSPSGGGDCGRLYRRSGWRQVGGGLHGLCGVLGGGRVWLERLRFLFLSLCSCRGVDGLGWSALGGACGGCRWDGRGRTGMVVLVCGRMWVMWEAGVVVRVVQREV